MVELNVLDIGKEKKAGMLPSAASRITDPHETANRSTVHDVKDLLSYWQSPIG
ncbi:hypothetical protein Ancab_014711 [Ancistrocladus abbreviatus]